MEYIKERYTLPVPLNLIPTPMTTYNLLKVCFKKINECNKKTQSGNCTTNNQIDDFPSVYEMKSQTSAFPNTQSLAKIAELPSKVFFNCWFLKYFKKKFFYNHLFYKFRKKENDKQQNEVFSLENQKLTYRVGRIKCKLFELRKFNN